MNKKKLGGLGKLSQFSGIKSSQPIEETKVIETTLIDSNNQESEITSMNATNEVIYHEEISVIDETVDSQIINEQSVINKKVDSQIINEQSVIDETINTQVINEDLVINQTVEEKPVTKKAVTKKPKKSIKDKPVTINIKISKSQKDWLSDTASMVRDNNNEPVPPAERVYPQHLIGVAISLLQSSDIDWSQVKNEKELRELLNL
ncbi:hypothetical protein [Crocosphaera sp. XPORK-15E]|uniref:hypothetical protein n=1 Tax=Crocosphaera sp. XPORK-15E TaxID=3110247 RepID=UPI002B210CD5|nr:hypothetical protein [Crocosphaera sp. XPORK-15E]MEA5536846.1 hypothetical protein [Crocosphaera sp. XPORK-15E]